MSSTVGEDTPRYWMDGGSGSAVGARADVAERVNDSVGEDEALTPALGGATRRGFLKGLGISGVVFTAAACERLPVRKAIPYVDPPEEITPGMLVHYASTCAGCSAACGLNVTTRDGRPIKMEGLKEHPRSQGGLCATGQAEVRGLYDAGRLSAPSISGGKASWGAVDKAAIAAFGAAASVGVSGGVYVVAPTITSPTTRTIVDRFVAKYSGVLVEYDAPGGSSSSVMAAYEKLDGKAAVPQIDIGAADYMVTLASDLLGTGAEPVAHTAQYAARRRRRIERDFRHIHFESNLSHTGAAADDRVIANAAERRLAALNLLKMVAQASHAPFAQKVLRVLGSGVAKLPNHLSGVSEIAAELASHGATGLVVSGSDDVAEQLAVAMLNRLLSAEGKTISLTSPSTVRRGRDSAWAAFLAAAKRREVGAVVFLGGNPVEELPGCAAAVAGFSDRVFTVAISDRPNGTVKASRIAAPAYHHLEAWGDAEAALGVLTIAQPTIRPLPVFDSRHPVENLMRWVGDGSSYLDAMRNAWRESVYDPYRHGSFELFWTASLARGMAPEGVGFGGAAGSGDELSETVDGVGSGGLDDAALGGLLASITPSDPHAVEVELLREVGVGDGRNSFNPWCREMSDPLTRTSWVGAVRLAPRQAAKLQAKDGDVVAVTVGEQTVEMPARIVPGQHPDVIGVPVGYGLVDGDAVAAGEPARNGYLLAQNDGETIKSQGLRGSIKVTGKAVLLPIVQTHPSAEGRPIIGEVSSPTEELHLGHHHGEAHSLWTPREYETHWEMVIDLDACTGCSACLLACQAENNLPIVGPEEMARHRDMTWIRIDRYFSGDEDDPDILFEPMMCAQCDNAPCETVCPVAATVHGHDGLNMQAYNRCVGTRYCANNCPYKARRFNWLDNTPKNELERMVLNPDVVVRERGVMEKCTFCVQRIQRGRIAARASGDPKAIEVETACQQSCPAGAISFGNGSRKEDGLDELKESKRAFQVLADVGVLPSTTYMARVRRRSTEVARHDKHG